jgi:hypothetical protein
MWFQLYRTIATTSQYAFSLHAIFRERSILKTIQIEVLHLTKILNEQTKVFV